MPTTSSIRTAGPNTSPPGGTPSTGTRSISASIRPRSRAKQATGNRMQATGWREPGFPPSSTLFPDPSLIPGSPCLCAPSFRLPGSYEGEVLVRMRFFSAFRFPALRILASLLSVLLPAAAIAQGLAAGSGNYTVYQGDKAVGSANYNVQPTPNGYAITSSGKLTLTKFSYSFNNTQHLDHDRNLVSDQLTGNVNGNPVTFTVNSDPSGRQFNISISANGKQTQNTVDRHQHLVLLPDLDPAAYLLMTRVVMDNPPTSWILIPKQDGILVPSSIARGAAVHGRRNGSLMDVQHATVAISSENPVNVDLYYT